MHKKARLQCNSITFIISIALFFTLLQNSLFFVKVWQAIELNSLRHFMFVATMPVVLFCCLNIMFSLLLLPYIRKPIAIIFILVGAAINYFMYSYNTVIDRNMTQNALETNPHEIFDLITFKMVLWLTLLGVIPALIVAFTRIKSAKSPWYLFGLRVVNIIGSVFILLLIAAFFYKDYAPFLRNNKDIVKTLVPANVISSLVNNLIDYIDSQRPFVQIGLDAKKGDLIKQQPKKTLLVLVIGETARSENFSLGSYGRNTNPQLAKRSDLLYFNDVSSCGTSTAISVPCMFSNMSRNDYSASEAKYSEGVLDILARAEVNVFWRENDGGCKGVCDRVLYEDVSKLNLAELCTDGTCFDEVLLHKLDDYINQLDNDGIIILHQIGSHGPAYYRRYPNQYRRFTPTCDTNQIQDCDRETLKNTYDNTIVYTDAMLDQTISLLENYSDKFATSMIYISDHGESLGENGLYLHGTPYAIAPSQQTQIPMLIWLSPDYQKSQRIDLSCLSKEAKERSFSQDNLFHSLLGIFAIQTSEYQQSLDIFQNCRHDLSLTTTNN